jgi:topoisomerase-4 subunit A
MYIDFKLYSDRVFVQIHVRSLWTVFKSFVRAIDDDLQRLTQIRWYVLRVSTDKADDFIAKLEEEMKEVQYNLEHLTDFAIAYFTKLKRYGKGRERQTELRILMISKDKSSVKKYQIICQ